MRQMVFWDAWAFIALADKGFRYYQEARGVKQQLQMEEAFLVTTEAVLSEVGNAFSKVKLRHLAIQQIEFAYDAEHTGNGKIASVPTDLWNRAFELYKQRPDKDWGHTDCISFIVMRELGLEKAFTADQHFEQAGFTRLVKPA